MVEASIFCRRLRIATVASFLSLFAATAAQAQNSKQSDLIVSPTPADQEATRTATHLNHHATPTRTLRASASRGAGTLSSHPDFEAATTSAAHDQDLVRFPADVSYQGGPVVEFAESHAIFMLPNGKCEISQCWGDPEGFLRDLAGSELIHVADQYVGLREGNRYTVGRRAKVSFTPPPVPFTDADILTVVHAVASATGQAGYGHIYHVFLPPGTDECFDATFTVCYSPDNNSTFGFCAYHASADFSDIGHVLYSVEPFQNVPGCQDRPGTPNGQLVDSTNDALSHELFETITDPDGTAWWNSTPSVIGLLGEEIGDECVFIAPPAFGDPSVFTIGRKLYAVQLEYANSKHGCANEP
jgi:hypothetical protein